MAWINRKEAGNYLNVSPRQIQRYLNIATRYLSSFSSFIDPITNRLNGSPVTKEQLDELKKIQDVLRKYKNSKNREQQIASELNNDKH